MVKIEKGVEIKSKAKWRTFGKFIINIVDLDDLVLNVRYLSGSQVPKFKKQDVSEEFYNILSYLLDTAEINYELIKQLSEKEKGLLDKLITLAGLKKQLNYKKSKTEPSILDLKNRYNVLSGEIEAGNNSADVKKELIDIIKLLVEKKVISKSDSIEMINEINEIK
jgi:acyl-CoA-binding protein